MKLENLKQQVQNRWASVKSKTSLPALLVCAAALLFAATAFQQSCDRRAESKVKSGNQGKVSTAFYEEIVQGGKVVKFLPNNQIEEKELSREQMIERVRQSPEAVSEIVENWLNSAHAEIYISADEDPFDFIFSPPDEIKVLWYLGERLSPSDAALLTFKSPTAEARLEYEENVTRYSTTRRGDTQISEISTNFNRKLEFGKKHLLNVEGVAVETKGQEFKREMKDRFSTLFNPIWFADCVDALFEAFISMRGK